METSIELVSGRTVHLVSDPECTEAYRLTADIFAAQHGLTLDPYGWVHGKHFGEAGWLPAHLYCPSTGRRHHSTNHREILVEVPSKPIRVRQWPPPPRRCRKQFVGEPCILERGHEAGFGHQFAKAFGGVITLDDPVPPLVTPNWMTAPYPLYAPWWRRLTRIRWFFRELPWSLVGCSGRDDFNDWRHDRKGTQR